MTMRAIIPAAGFGTRHAPVTFFIDKELFPLGAHPAIYYGINELYESSILNVKIITTSDKIALFRYGDPERYHIERVNGDAKKATENAKELIKNVNNVYHIQQEFKGPANAIYEARDFVRDEEYFCVLLPDDICFYKREPVMKQLCKVAYKKQTAIIGLQRIKTQRGTHSIITKFSSDDTGNVRIIRIREIKKIKDPGEHLIYIETDKNLFELKNFEDYKNQDINYIPEIIESVGRYVLKKDFLEYTKKWLEEHKNDKEECMITTIINNMMADNQEFFGFFIDGKRYDLGIPEDRIKAEHAHMNSFKDKELQSSKSPIEP